MGALVKRYLQLADLVGILGPTRVSGAHVLPRGRHDYVDAIRPRCSGQLPPIERGDAALRGLDVAKVELDCRHPLRPQGGGGLVHCRLLLLFVEAFPDLAVNVELRALQRRPR